MSYTDTSSMGRSGAAVSAVLLAISVGACASRGATPRPFPGMPEPAPTAVESPSDRSGTPPGAAPETGVPRTIPDSPTGSELVIQTALSLLGVPYRNGGHDPSGFDCSGFVQYVFAQHQLPLPRQVSNQYEQGRAIDLKDVRVGDLLFFETVSRGASHVGIALGNGRFIHAPSSRGVVRVEPYTASYWARRFVGARRLVASDPIERASLPGSVRSSQ